MKILNHIFGKKTPTSTAIAAELEKARAEHADGIVKRGAALAGLSTMSDAEHIKAEAEYQAQRRAADRAEARVAELEKAHADALAAEAEAGKRAQADRFRARVEAARNAIEIEAAELLSAYDEHASAIANVLARLDAINTEANAVNENGRHVPGFEPVCNTDAAHRKHPDRPASERREKRLCWVFKYPASPPDTDRVKYQAEAAREEVVEATINSDTGKAIPVTPERYNYFGRELIIRPTLDTREIVIERTNFRPGRIENPLSAIHLPPGFAFGRPHWPRERVGLALR
ncbi:hypothetical protein KIP88_37520 [Bradyrhizobium sp. SRL28]|uniref:hypothetical protein n=1 Tax=Bradyrhizobium sp. SRL28 TaxID=2836178 RepID=UPI001BDF0130|nr:hypothetical protein [Bradyrhizobium sp. SRL28]MBT1516164.1 hypothetical protein [Bradyrhizobium sp. SRL28]